MQSRFLGGFGVNTEPNKQPSGRRALGTGASRLAVAALSLAFAAGAAAPALAKAPKPGDWTGYLGYESSQYSPLQQIDKSNVSKLQVAWTFPTGEGPSPHFNPVVVNGVMYVLVGGDTIAALDATTGKELWRHKNQGRIGQRGINFWQSADGKDRRLLFINNGFLREVNADNGEPITDFGKDGGVDLRVGLAGDISKIRPLQTDNPGQIYKNLIIVSLPAGAYDFASPPADIHAYDVLTGKLVWIFHTVPQKGEYGYDTWPAKDHEKFGGVHNWSEAAIDPDLGIVYIPTGTARYDFYGGNRPGNNLFGNSILALDAATGKRLWSFQAVHHDLWDYDFSLAPKLMTIHKDGKDVPVIVQASKQGFVYVLNRKTGKPIWPIVERKVPASDVPGEKASPTQPFPTWPKPFARQDKFTEADINPYIPEADKEKVRALLKTARNEGIFTPPSLEGTIYMPGHNGGAEWGLAAIDPAHQRFFVAARNLPVYEKLSLDPRPEAAKDMPNGGGDVKPYRAPVDFMLQSNSLSALKPPWSTITAYDMNTGKIMWQVPDGDVMTLAEKGITGTGSHAPRGGLVATAGDLLFVGTSSDRKFRARDPQTGKVLWEADLPAATEGVPTVYEAGGREYVVIPVGGDGLFSNGLGLPAPGPNQYMAFALPRAGK
jgi:quinoprotein glucose dehydrogenase